jgi:hypothetical protein
MGSQFALWDLEVTTLSPVIQTAIRKEPLNGGRLPPNGRRETFPQQAGSNLARQNL